MHNPQKPERHRNRTIRALCTISAATFLLAACSSNNADNDTTPPTTDPDSADTTIPGDDIPLETSPTRTGTATLTIDDTTYTTPLQICDLDNETIGFIGTNQDPNLRLEYGPNTANQLILTLNPTGPLDPGDQTWTATPTITQQTNTTASTNGPFTITNTQGTTTDATIKINCPTN